MESRIPLPTDNIYKFYAFFGLLLFVFSASALLYQNHAHNELIFAAVPELADLKQVAQPTPAQKTRIAVLEKRVEIANSDHRAIPYVLGTISGISVLLIYYGFRRWHTEIQPLIDESAKVQLQIAELQLKKLRQEVEPKENSSSETIEA